MTAPTRDESFGSFARARADDAGTPTGLEAALREHYPRAVVRARDLDGDLHVIWYVYRDGRWTSS